MEESVESGTSRTENWVNKAEQSASRSVNEGVKTEMSPKDDANAKPPDYNQSMGWPYLMPQHNSQMQYGIQQFNTGQYQQLFPVNNPQNTFMMPNPSQMQYMNTSVGPVRGHTEEEKKEKMKAQLRKRKIPEEN